MTIVCQPIDVSAGAPTYTAQQSRQAWSAHLLNGTSRPLGAVSGRRPGLGLSVTATSSTWTVQPGAAVIDPGFTTAQAPYEMSSDAVVTGPVTAANASNPRIDIVYVQVNDTVIDGSGLRNAQILYLAGTAAASPVAPTLPARSLLLATINVPTLGGGSPTTSAYPNWSVSAGGVLPVSNGTFRDAILTNPYDGQVVYDQTLNAVEVYDGGAWRVLVQDRTTYVPTWTCAGGAPSVGNGTLTGWYQIVGRRCDIGIELVFGSTTSGGTQGWSFALPFASATGPSSILSGEAITSNFFSWAAYGRITSAVSVVAPFAATNNTSGSASPIQNASAGAAPGTGVPQVASAFSFATGARLSLHGSYWLS